MRVKRKTFLVVKEIYNAQFSNLEQSENISETEEITKNILIDIYIQIRIAARMNQTSVVRQLIERNNIDINSIYIQEENILLYYLGKGDAKMLKYIFKYPLSNQLINEQDYIGNTAINLAARNSQIKIVEQLIDQHANIEIPNDQGFTALYTAIYEFNYEVVRLLINQGAQMVNETNQNLSPAMVLSAEWLYGECECKLADLTNQGRTQILEALKFKHKNYTFEQEDYDYCVGLVKKYEDPMIWNITIVGTTEQF